MIFFKTKKIFILLLLSLLIIKIDSRGLKGGKGGGGVKKIKTPGKENILVIKDQKKFNLKDNIKII